jgi:hypothetical protein
MFPAPRKPESNSIPIALLSRVPDVTVCSCSTSNDLYDVKSPLVQVTVVPAETFRRFGTKNLLLLGDEEPGTIVTEALTDTGIVSFPSKADMSLTLIDTLSPLAHKEGAKIPVPARVMRTIAKERAVTCLKQSKY